MVAHQPSGRTGEIKYITHYVQGPDSNTQEKVLLYLGYFTCRSLGSWVPPVLKDACKWTKPNLWRQPDGSIRPPPDTPPYLCTDPYDPTQIMPTYQLDWWNSPGVDAETFYVHDAKFQDAFALYCRQVSKKNPSLL